MEELYSIMRDFLEVEHNQESLLCLLKAVEATYREKNEDSKWIANSANYYLHALQGELREAINRLDSYIVEKAGER